MATSMLTPQTRASTSRTATADIVGLRREPKIALAVTEQKTENIPVTVTQTKHFPGDFAITDTDNVFQEELVLVSGNIDAISSHSEVYVPKGRLEVEGDSELQILSANMGIKSTGNFKVEQLLANQGDIVTAGDISARFIVSKGVVKARNVSAFGISTDRLEVSKFTMPTLRQTNAKADNSTTRISASAVSINNIIGLDGKTIKRSAFGVTNKSSQKPKFHIEPVIGINANTVIIDTLVLTSSMPLEIHAESVRIGGKEVKLAPSMLRQLATA